MRLYWYCLVEINEDTKLWYRANSDRYKVKREVIVPIFRDGKYSLNVGKIHEIKAYYADYVPYPLEKTKRIYAIADKRTEAIAELINQKLADNKLRRIDISWSNCPTEYGNIKYLAQESERQQQRKIFENDKSVLVTEDYPTIADEDQPFPILVHLGLARPIIRNAEDDRTDPDEAEYKWWRDVFDDPDDWIAWGDFAEDLEEYLALDYDYQEAIKAKPESSFFSMLDSKISLFSEPEPKETKLTEKSPPATSRKALKRAKEKAEKQKADELAFWINVFDDEELD